MATKARLRLEQFVAAVGGGQYRPQQRFIFEALRGLNITRSTILADWARSLREDRRLIHTERRLSRNLNATRFRDHELESAALELVAPLVRSRCEAVAIDGSDIRKEYSRKQPFLAHVHDGDKDEICTGWSLMHATGVAKNGRHIPIYTRVHSHAEPGHRGEYGQLEDCIDVVQPHVSKETPFLFDSGFDSRKNRELFLEKGLRFIVRLNTSGNFGQRSVFSLASEEPQGIVDFIDAVPLVGRTRIRTFTAKAKRDWRVQVGFVKIRFAAA